MAEYSFFRAEGMSLSAVETAEEARLEWHDLRKQLLKRYGADTVFFDRDKETGELRIDCFAWSRSSKLPEEGWDIDMPDQDAGIPSGMPKKGSKEAFHVANMNGLMQRSAKNMVIENVFGVAEMPRKGLPAGKYSGSFVRDKSLEEAGDRPRGSLRDRSTFCFGSNSAITTGDSIEYMKMDGAWYIRVPNKPGMDEPQFTPPDAVPVAYERMLELDKTEYDIRYRRPSPPQFGGGGAFC